MNRALALDALRWPLLRRAPHPARTGRASTSSARAKHTATTATTATTDPIFSALWNRVITPLFCATHSITSHTMQHPRHG